ncbi:TonB family protein [Sphingomonas sp. CGMCC 1.13654]|uniref:TonB family protein n=1 Tax=Sphingomonas chungangi TaxID=2683589 RepID=A0A838L5V4_9SPHN|nr:TonB family protein [Sphingomonas chungangi]MBA2934310.1 TonB family protein [Sphingomonas chungangi]
MIAFLAAAVPAAVARPDPPVPIDAGTWITPKDYPAAARRASQAGVVSFELDVDASGLVTDCRIKESSGQPLLDQATCPLLRSRAHFTPAHDAVGRTIASSYSNRIRWALPLLAPPPPVVVTMRPSPVVAVPRWPLAPSMTSIRAYEAAPPVRMPARPRLAPPPPPPSFDPAPPPVADSPTPVADSRALFGKLPNGLRYAILRNGTPRGGVSFRLRVGVGSVDEGDKELGYAHLLEHMTFRGSEHVPDGDFEKSMEQMGLSFGKDTVANTTPEDTIFGLDFPPSRLSAAAEGLFMLREATGRATISPTALQAERAVVLAEGRWRDDPSLHAEQARQTYLLAGQRIPQRWTFGTPESIAAASADGLRRFYKTHYRPDRSILVITGNVVPNDMEAMIKATFGNWASDGSPPPVFDQGGVKRRGSDVRIFTEPGAPQRIEIDWVSRYDDRPDSFDRERQQLAEWIAASILNARLDRAADQPGAPFSAAAIDRSTLYHSAQVTTLSLIPIGDAIDKAVQAALIEQRRLTTLGVTQAEIDRERLRLTNQLDQAATAENNRNSADLANTLLASMVSGDTFATPSQRAIDYERLIATLTPVDIQAAAKRLVSGSGPLLFISTGKAPAGGEAALRVALGEAERAPLAAQQQDMAGAWPYTHFGAPGRIAERKDVADLGLTIVRFANGTSITLKRAPSLKDSVMLDANFGAGFAGLPPGLEQSYWMLTQQPQTFILGGLGKADATDIAEMLNGKNVGANFYVSEERFHLTGGTNARDFETELQLLTAYLSDPAFRPRAAEQAKARLVTALPELSASPTLMLQRDEGFLLHARDPRWGPASPADLDRSRPSDLAAILRPALAGPINIVMVGDLDIDRAIEVARNTIGSLPDRTARPAIRDAHFPAATPSPVTEISTGRQDQGIALAAWPTPGFFASTADARAIQVMSQIIQVRLIDGLREKEGLTYAPTTYIDQSELFPGYGMIAATVEIEPTKVDTFFAELNAIVQDLAARPVSIEELSRSRTPLLEESKTLLSTGTYWLSALPCADSDPRYLDTIRSRPADLAGVTPAAIQRLAAQYLASKAPYKLVVRPAPKPPGG